MKDVLFPQTRLNSTSTSLSARALTSKFDAPMALSQARTFGPLLGFLFANFLTRVVQAKFDPYSPFNFAHASSPWLPYNKPEPIHHFDQYPHHEHYHHHDYAPNYDHHPQWQPIENPYTYGSSLLNTYPTLTTKSPYNDEVYQHEEFLDLQPPNVDFGDSYAEASNGVTTTIESPTSIVEPVAAGSNTYNRRRPPPRKRTTPKPKRPQKRRRTTTPPPDYYDSYEDYSSSRFDSSESYEYTDNDSFERTTKPYNRRRPTKTKTKRRKVTESPVYEDESFEGAQTEIVIVRQRQQTTTTEEPDTEITDGTTTTDASTTTLATTTTTNSTGDYGPDNGYGHISITYGPPYQFSGPYVDWYNDESSRNDVVRKVHEIVGSA